ncbi:MAG: methyltransferase domain-containing protein [Desulfobacterales bacterium]|nr:methyltransferase domain-containing protein [Desulfobacterales bacterium]
MADKGLRTRFKTPALTPGHIPPWLKQTALLTVNSDTLRPGGLTLTRRAAEFCNFTPGNRILDVGCGSGMTLSDLAGNLRIHGTGCDPDPVQLARAGRKTSAPQSFVQSGLPDLPFAPESWDGIFCECVLSLFSYRPDCLAELYRLTAPKGHLVITDLYLRKWMPELPFQERIPAGTCLEGAIPMFQMLQAIEGAGFDITMIEDHSPLLRQLGTATAFSGRRMQKTGYCMIVARKY